MIGMDRHLGTMGAGGQRSSSNTCSAALLFGLFLTVGAAAQTVPQVASPSPKEHPRLWSSRWGRAEAFSFISPQGADGSEVVKGVPFSAEIVSEIVQQLPDGNRIDRKFSGTLARDAEGRMRREIVLDRIGPLAAAGQPPHLVFLTDPVSGKAYWLDLDRRIARELPYFPNRTRLAGSSAALEAGGSSPQHLRIAGVQSEPLGQKVIEGVLAEGVRLTRTIPAGAVGNEKPLVITTERWYSPEIQSVVLQIRSDPRFGTTTYRLTNIARSDPPPALFIVPEDFRIESGHRARRGPRQGGETNFRDR